MRRQKCNLSDLYETGISFHVAKFPRRHVKQIMQQIFTLRGKRNIAATTGSFKLIMRDLHKLVFTRNCPTFRPNYLLHQLPDDAVPLFGFRIVGTVHVIRHKAYCVLESHLVRDPPQQLYAEAVVSRVSSQVLVLLHHHVWTFLKDDNISFAIANQQQKLLFTGNILNVNV